MFFLEGVAAYEPAERSAAVGRPTHQRDGAGVVCRCASDHDDLSGAEILGRTQGNAGWFAFYALFVAAVSVHAPIGLRTILAETFNWRGRSANVFSAIVGLSLAMWGLRAVMAVFGGGQA